MNILRNIIAIQTERRTDLGPALPYLSRIGVLEVRSTSIIVDAGPDIGMKRLRKKLIMLRSALHVILGNPVRIGAGSGTVVSLVAAKRSMPGGITIVPPGNEPSFLDRTAIDLLPGIGRRTATYLRNRGVRTIGQFNKLSQYAAVKLFGISGIVLHDYSRGNDPREIIAIGNSEPDVSGRQSLFSVFSKKHHPALGVAAGMDIA
ncbi:MAG: hypothetical protein V1907_02240 [Candidatus Kerfeldbacteria bacterium]